MPQLSPQLAIYSADPNITLSQLKKWEYDPNLDTSQILEYCQKHKIQGIQQEDSDFPAFLKKYKSAPRLFYYQGDLSLLKQDLLAVVGPRTPSDYAQQVMESFFEKSKNYKLCTISGFARGIDQITHRLSLQAGIPTIAVLGGGFSHYLRGRDRGFLEEIVEKWGLVISQFKIGFEPTKWSFPMRNKLIAQLAKAVFLPEAKTKSWSLITTEFAYEYQKPVYSVPAPIFAAQSAGIFQKMQEEKIKLTTDFDHCLSQHFQPLEQSFSVEKITHQNYENLSPEAKNLITQMQHQQTCSLESLMASVQLEYGQVLQLLTLLEMQGLIAEIRPNTYQLK